MINFRAAFLLTLLAAPAAHAQTPPKNPRLAALALAPSPDAAPTAPAIRYNHPMADTLVWLLAKLERHDYQGLGNRNGHSWLGADKMELSERKDGPVLSLQFTAANSGGKAAIGEAKVAFQRLVAGGPFKQGETTSRSVSLEKNGHETFNCYIPAPARMAEIGYLILTIYTFVPLDRWLADEAPYHGKFPGTITPTDAPQVWELRGRATGPDSYQRYNGVFKDGVLVRGSKTFHGYGDYLDGVWLSNHWTESDYAEHPGTGAVEFRPAGTTDVVYGSFADEQMQDFNADLRHKSARRNAVAGGFYPDAPLWLRKTLLDHRQQQYLARVAAAATRAEQYQRDHPYVPGTAPTYARPAETSPGRRTSEHEVTTTCNACGGGGYDTYTDRYGHSSREHCRACGGTGKLTRSYRY